MRLSGDQPIFDDSRRAASRLFGYSGRAVLFGLGADIGATLLSHNDPVEDGFAITDVVTRPVSGGGTLAALAARLILADPSNLGHLHINPARSELIIHDRRVRVHLADLVLDDIGFVERADLAIVATHRDHVRSAEVMAKVRTVAANVIGVAENTALPGLYAPLVGSPTSGIALDQLQAAETSGIFALGSCQCVGWAAQLRGLIEAGVAAGHHDIGLRRAEVDIVHPDTASSRFGTYRVGARDEDARGNLRPGSSQLAASMQRIGGVKTLNTVSLRALVQPPGFQISRFYIEAPLTYEDVRAGVLRASHLVPQSLNSTPIPIGSRAFAAARAAATIIATPEHLRVIPNVLPDSSMTAVFMQAYVHNTIGYCSSVLAACRELLHADDLVVLAPMPAAPAVAQ